MLFVDKPVQLSAVSNQNRLVKLPQGVRGHSTRLPHQQKNKKVGDQENYSELVRALENGSRKTHRFAVCNRSRPLRSAGTSSGCATNRTLTLAGAHDSSTAAAH